ncbi:MAG: hypothetical protein M1818_002567 [Claussenomyces sp. TS43310]|nr:MAG: hypothetical protein M1818_002567 [Claussenomyces sp. TS43310]
MAGGERSGVRSGEGAVDTVKSTLLDASSGIKDMATGAAAHFFGIQKAEIVSDGETRTNIATKALVNRAGESRSPYVRAHRNNAVAWQLWGDEAIDRAKEENKLLFISIGYNACHWCHVMERESFENEEVASILNAEFIPIKIDREERPDIDRIYMNFVQATTGSGGWPLNVFVTPTLEPLFGGTYWPGPNSPTPQLALEDQVDFLSILRKLSTVWKEQEDRCRLDSAQILGQLKEFAAEGTFGASRLGPGPASLDLELLEESYEHFRSTFDTKNSGFGSSPKFPTPSKLGFLLRLSHYPQAVKDVVGEKECGIGTQMAILTLKAMARGGIHDQIGHGFARYSVTADWSLPHFEKMLYDNAQLLHVYLDAFLSSSDPEILGVVYDLATYLTEGPLKAPQGGFFSSEDADSLYRKGDAEKREGAFYVWTRRELDALLKQPAASICSAFWGVRSHGNVQPENDAHDEFINQNVLKVANTPKILAGQFGMSEAEVVKVIKQSREKLRNHREAERVRPGLDDKIVVAWNGIAIGALARTARVIEKFDPKKAEIYRASAADAATFIRNEMYDASTKTLKRVWREGAGETSGFADDYAFLIEGLIDLYETTSDEEYLKCADELQGTQISLFFDAPTTNSQASGGFFATPVSAPHTILRLKDGMDTSEPSTNGISSSNLYRLSSLLSDDSYAEKAEQTIAAFESEILQYPWLFTSFMPGIVAGRLGIKGTVIVEPKGEVVNAVTEDASAGDPAGSLSSTEIGAHGALTTRITLSHSSSWLRERNPLLRDLSAPEHGPRRIMICENGTCREHKATVADTSPTLAAAAATSTLAREPSPTVAPALVETAPQAVHVARLNGLKARADS